jgi:hypothetical protein
MVIPKLISCTCSETKVPSGYQKAQGIVFDLNASGKIVLEKGDGLYQDPRAG